MHPETLDHDMLELTTLLGFLKGFSFYLAGGTGLALQMGHRKSFDLDFFTSKEFLPEELSSEIKKHNLSLEGEMRRHRTLYCVLEGVKTSFIFYDALLIFPTIEFNSINVADWRDITAEKLRTVGDRGKKKDFYDLFFGVQEFGINNTVETVYRKYGKKVNYFHLLKGISYFEDAERDPEPILLNKTVSWEQVKDFFITHLPDFENSFRSIINQ